jgi:glycosyltransferase involved in cell wall biosynthesis
LIILSVITVNKNNLAGLQRTVESLRSLQDYAGLVQLICIDGNSCDGSINLVKSFYAPDSLVIECDKGPYDAMNKGLLLAKGRFSFWLNSGDEFLPNCLPKLIDILSHSRSSIVCCGTLMTNPGTQISFEKYSGRWQLPLSSPNHQSTFIRTSVAKAAGGYSSLYRIAADRDLILSVLRLAKGIEEHHLLVSKYYLGGISSNYSVLQMEHLDISLSHSLIGRSQYYKQRFLIFIRIFLNAFIIKLRCLFAPD